MFVARPAGLKNPLLIGAAMKDVLKATLSTVILLFLAECGMTKCWLAVHVRDKRRQKGRIDVGHCDSN